MSLFDESYFHSKPSSGSVFTLRDLEFSLGSQKMGSFEIILLLNTVQMVELLIELIRLEEIRHRIIFIILAATYADG